MQKHRLSLIRVIPLIIFAAVSFIFVDYVNAALPSSLIDNFTAAPGSTQYVVIMNALSNITAENLSKSDVLVRFYDGTGDNPPCWIAEKIAYHSDPYVAGAGGKNACGKFGLGTTGIIKLDIYSLKAPAGKIYQDLYGVSINPRKFYTGLIIEQNKAPVFNGTGTLKIPGTIKVSNIN